MSTVGKIGKIVTWDKFREKFKAPEQVTLELPILTVIQSMLNHGYRIGISCPKAIGIKFWLIGERNVSS